MATAAETGFFRPLTENPFLRLATVFIFYIFEGVPMGMFYLAVPAWMASDGASAPQIAAVVGAFSLPWSLKLVNGFFMDRYTWLPMGRRRIWIIGSQSLMALGLLACAVIAPEARDVALLSAFAFVISAATTFQDVSIDSLIVDIMDEKDQAKSGGIMFGAQILGMSGATAATGYLLDHFGARAAFGAAAGFLLIGVLFAIIIRERPGEKRFPWSEGQAHPRNIAIKIGAWVPLLKQSLKAMLGPASLIILPFLLLRNISGGTNDVFNPILSADYVGWTTTQFTNTNSLAQVGVGMLGLFLGGALVARIGSRPVLATCFLLLGIEFAAIGLLQEHWGDPRVLIAIIWATELFGIFLAIAMIPLAMQICTPAVAATQFTIYMAIANFGRPIGAAIAGALGEDSPQMMYFTVAGLMLVTGVAAFLFLKNVKRPMRAEGDAHIAGPVEN
jgi:PAT family beta-lactamase induction signal transducer AmpG